MKKILAFMADGLEEVEALTTVDLLRREGFSVVMASVSGNDYIAGAHEIIIKADTKVSDAKVEDFDAVVLPGGSPGFKNLAASKEVKDITTEAAKAGKLVAAICAAPTVLGGFGLLEGKNACCYPGMEDGLTGAKANEKIVNTDGNIITSRGVGTAIEFALAIIEYFDGKEAADKMAKSVVWERR